MFLLSPFLLALETLYKLTEQTNQSFQCNEESEDSFQRLKTALTSTPVLAYLTCHDSSILDTDACNQRIRAVLL